MKYYPSSVFSSDHSWWRGERVCKDLIAGSSAIGLSSVWSLLRDLQPTSEQLEHGWQHSNQLQKGITSVLLCHGKGVSSSPLWLKALNMNRSKEWRNLQQTSTQTRLVMSKQSILAHVPTAPSGKGKDLCEHDKWNACLKI